MQQTGSGREQSVDGEQPEPTRGHGMRAPLLATLVVLAVWGVVAAFIALQAAQDLKQARDSFGQAETALRDLDLSQGATVLAEGVEASQRAAGRLASPPVVGLRWVPMLGNNLRAASTLAEGATDTGSAAVQVLEVVKTVADEDGDPDTAELPLTTLRALQAPLRTLADELALATQQIADLPDSGLIERIAEARQQYLELTGPQLERVVLAADFVEALPAFLGADEPRRYLIGAAALSEARGSLGLMGSWSVLTADAGTLEFDDFLDVEDLETSTVDVDAPHPDIAERYGRFGVLRSWRNANMTPDFPSAGHVYLSLWEATGQQPLDGVILADPVLFERMVQRSGPVEVPGVTTLAPEDVIRFVGMDAYAVYEDDVELRKLVLGAVATAAFTEAIRVFDAADLGDSIETLAEITQGGHLVVYSADPAMQSLFERAGVSGELAPSAAESLVVAVNNAAAHKVDFFGSRRFEHAVALRADGVVRAQLTADFANGAPTEGLPSRAIGPNVESLEAGDNLSLITVLCGMDCSFLDTPSDAWDGGRELGRPASDLRLHLPAGSSQTLVYETQTRDAWWWEDGRMIVEVDHLLAATLFGTELSVRVTAPDGMRFVSLPDGATVDPTNPDDAVWESTLSGRVVLRFELEPR